MNKCSGSPVTALVELLVLEALVGQMLWKPLAGWVTGLGSLGWTNSLEALYKLWVEILVLEALIGQTLWKPWMETNLMMGFGDV